MKGSLKEALDILAASERDAIAMLGFKAADATRGRRMAELERWEWIVRHSAGTVFRGVTEDDMILGLDC